jgi:hypothetical protein
MVPKCIYLLVCQSVQCIHQVVDLPIIHNKFIDVQDKLYIMS